MDTDADTVGKPTTGRGRESFYERHEWTILGILALVTFAFACLGFAQVMVFAERGGEFTWWDVPYASVRLFIFDGPESTAGWPLHLQIARALAPVIVIYTAIKAVWTVAGQQISLYGLLFQKRRYVVVCGIGETGFRIARDYCENSDKRVIVIDTDPYNALAAELEGYGAISIVGNAMDPSTLIKARVIYAKELFICTRDDTANIAIAKAAERLSRRLRDREVRYLERVAARHEPSIAGEPPSVALRCFLCVDEPDLYEVFASHSFFEIGSPRFEIRVFNRRETIARNIFRICAPDLYYLPRSARAQPMHVLFIGFQALTREMILQTALTAHYTDFRLPFITVLCHERFDEKVRRFLHRYPHLENTVQMNVVYEDPVTITPERLQEMEAVTHFDVAYVCLEKDVEAILAARRMNRLRRLQQMSSLNFVVCLNQQSFIADIIDDDFPPLQEDKSHLPAHEPIEYFQTLDETINIEVVVNEALDALARTLHNAYLQTQLAAGGSAADNASLIPWSALPAHKKKANQHAAAHIDIKLRIAHCEARRESDPAPEARFPPDDATMEALARLEHRRWMADKYIAGYSYGPERDEDRMLHPDLVPWERLTESDKQKDRDNIRQIAGLLKLQGLKICASAP
jgi:hypothetical protein